MFELIKFNDSFNSTYRLLLYPYDKFMFLGLMNILNNK